MSAPKNRRGVTLIELMTTLGVVAVVLTLGVPGFKGLQTNMQRSQAMLELSASFNLARSEAVRRGQWVTICPSLDGITCYGSSSGSWASGWMVFVDLDGDSIRDETTDKVIHRITLAPGPFSLNAQPQIAGGVTFSAGGLPSSHGRYSFCDQQESRQLVLTPIGRMEPGTPELGCQ